MQQIIFEKTKPRKIKIIVKLYLQEVIENIIGSYLVTNRVNFFHKSVILLVTTEFSKQFEYN